jgi:rhodanese-related sulfurtransferase
MVSVFPPAYNKKRMNSAARLLFPLTFIAILFSSHSFNNEVYCCMPCGSECDKLELSSPGTCVHCQMPLVKKSTIKFKHIPASGICDYIKKNPSVVLLDVRTREEFEGKADPNFGSLPRAINIPIQELEQRLGEIKHLRKKEIIVYCSHSRRSPRASYLLYQNGFEKVINMEGGMSVLTGEDCVKMK